MIVPKIKVAVAGTAFGGDVQIPVFQTHPRTQVVAVSSGRAERARQSAKEHGIPACYIDFEEMLDTEKPDLVSIATPPENHFPMTMAALRRGIHVLCEKPFALSLSEAKEMKDAADRTPVVAMIDFEFRFAAARAYAAELLKENYVGEVRMADFNVHFGWRSHPEDRPWSWWSDATRGGGVLGAFGSHAVDALRTVMGNPKRVFCDLTTFVKERDARAVTSDDAFTLIIEFLTGSRATVQITQAAGIDDARFGIYGSEGQLVIPTVFMNELYGGKRSGGRTGRLDIPERFRQAPEKFPLRSPFRALVTHLAHAIDNKLPSPSPNFEDALWSQTVLDAAFRSAQDRTWVDI